MDFNKNEIVLSAIKILTSIMAVALTLVSIFGGFFESTYERDHPSMAAQGMGQDIVDLFFVIPVLLVSLVFMLKKNKRATFLFGGTLMYILYSFIIYSLGIHFNNLFLLYCLILGCSLYLFILYFSYLRNQDIKDWFEERVPIKSTGIYLITIAFLFYFLWLKDIIPAIKSNTIPESVSEYHLLVNPVHVIDLAIALPGLIITSFLLFKRNKWGYILTPIFLVFTIILALALVGMAIMMKIKNISEDNIVVVIFLVLAAISSTFLFLFLRKLKKVV